MDMHIFRAYDIRGIAGKEVTTDFAQNLGRSFGSVVREAGGSKVSLGHDCRLSSPELYRALAEGLCEVGCDVYGIGMNPTPVTYFSEYHLSTDANLMITASHNPPEYNGFKMGVMKKTLYGDAIKALGTRIIEKRFAEAGGRKGTFDDRSAEVADAYVAFMKQKFQHIPSTIVAIKPIIDCGNGAAGPIAKRVYAALGLQAEFLFSEPDGRFPNHAPDPVDPENIEALISKVKATSGAIGIGYDGDGDRLGVVAEDGNLVFGDMLLVFFAKGLKALKAGQAPTVLGEVKCSQVLYDELEKMGARGLMWKTGHSLIKQKMREEKSLLAGEMSGHFFFAEDYFGYDDGVYASLKLLERLGEDKRPLSAFVGDLPKVVNTPEIRVECAEDKKKRVIDGLIEAFKGQAEANTIDGLRMTIQEADGTKSWALVRASNTQPVLVLRFEASDQSKLDDLRRRVEKEVQARL